MEETGSQAAATGIAMAAMFGYFVVSLVLYLYFSFCLMTIARKTGHTDDWMAWVPIVNIYYACIVAGKPGWWTILFFIPCVNIIMGILVWMAIAEKRNKPSWWGILIIVPCVNLIVPGYLAFSD
ncbi:MAG: DUF5684 domain-containing protein [Candidatus Polarisedimenticolia bacterium]|nr:DUF5684 domain-containing protein [bacterium]